MSTEIDRPATKRDLDEAMTRLERFVLDREIGMLWKFLLLALTLLGAQLVDILPRLKPWDSQEC